MGVEGAYQSRIFEVNKGMITMIWMIDDRGQSRKRGNHDVDSVYQQGSENGFLPNQMSSLPPRAGERIK